MILYVTYFTEKGKRQAERLAKLRLGLSYRVPVHGRLAAPPVTLRVRESYPSKDDWLTEAAEAGFPLLFIGAAGIAVRMTAPFVRDKEWDSPVLVMDEEGRYVVPLVSGHLGGANELAELFAAALGAQPVITTASDVSGVFAIDVFARRNGLRIADKSKLRTLAARLLNGERLTLAVEQDAPVTGRVPGEIELVPWSEYKRTGAADMVVCQDGSGHPASALFLEPKTLVLGIGTRKGKSYIEIEKTVKEAEERGLFDRHELFAVASVEAKEYEPGISELAQRLRVPFVVFSADVLAGLPGTYRASEFVKKTVGVDNVCERAAVAAASGDGAAELLVPKQASDGVTLAVARCVRPGLSF